MNINSYFLPSWLQTSFALVFCVGAMLSACGDNLDCSNNAECPGGQICVNNKCENGSYRDSDPSSDADSDTDTDTDADTDEDTDSETNADPDTETGPCTTDPTQENGQSCTGNCECYSRHCDNGVCCDSGTCCATAADCPDGSCGAAECRLNQCGILPTFTCGQTDLAGAETCSGADVCNGNAECMPAAIDCSPYASIPGTADCTGEQAIFICYTGCTDDTQCVAGSSCNGGVCSAVSGLADGAGCGADAECRSGHCGDGFCCNTGECCGNTADCNDLCMNAVCNAASQCVATPTGCGQADFIGNLTCEGTDRCDGFGNCVTYEACVTGNAAISYTCSAGTIAQNCSCQTNNDCDADDEFCNDGYLCTEGVCDFSAEAEPCPEDACHQGANCDEETRSCIAGTNPCDALATPCDPLGCEVTGTSDTDYACAANPLINGAPCDDGLGCNGTNDFCLDGACTPGGISANYCYNGNPCASDFNCVENGFGQEPECVETAVRSIGDPCSSDFSCFGNSATCQDDPAAPGNLICVQSEEPCEQNGICALYACSEDYSFGNMDGITCTSTVNDLDVSTLTCTNTSVTIRVAEGKFNTRTYFDYNTTCNDMNDSFIGMETRVFLELAQPVSGATITIDTIDASFTGNLEMLLFDSSACVETDCIQRGTNSLTFNSSDGNEVLVLDSIDALWPPETLTLELNCNL